MQAPAAPRGPAYPATWASNPGQRSSPVRLWPSWPALSPA